MVIPLPETAMQLWCGVIWPLAPCTGCLLTGTSGVAGPQPLQRIDEVQRLSLDSSFILRKLGSQGEAQLNNNGRGLNLPGNPEGDSMIVRSPVGPNLSSFQNSGKSRTLDGESRLYCQTAYDLGVPGAAISQIHTDFRPRALSARAAKTQVDMTYAVEDDTIVRWRFALRDAALSNSFVCPR